MKQFAGFPARSQYTRIENIFFSELMPRIDDINELRVTLYVFEMLYRKRGVPQYVSFREMLANPAVGKTLQGADDIKKVLHEALKKAVERGTLLTLDLKGKSSDEAYFLNTGNNRQTVARIQNGEMKLEGREIEVLPVSSQVEPPDIFTLYEENIGMLTPVIADELREADKIYPSGWISDAIKAAVANNKRSWAYISKILERWTTEGRSDGTHGRHTQENTDPDKYVKGKYGHLVRR
jgi:DNA replication protein